MASRVTSAFVMNERIKELQNIGIDVILRNKDLKNEYVRIYKNIFKTDLCSTCESHIKHSFLEFNKLTNLKIETMKNRLFNFRTKDESGRDDVVVLNIAATNEQLTNDKLTDERAIALLRSNKAYKKYFVNLPANWEALVAGTESLKPTPQVTIPVTEPVVTPAIEELIAPVPVLAPAKEQVFTPYVAPVQEQKETVVIPEPLKKIVPNYNNHNNNKRGRPRK